MKLSTLLLVLRLLHFIAVLAVLFPGGLKTVWTPFGEMQIIRGRASVAETAHTRFMTCMCLVVVSSSTMSHVSPP